MEHMELNEALGVNRSCNKGTNHMIREWIIRKRNGSRDKGIDLLKGDMEYL